MQAGIAVHWQSRGGIPGLEQQGLQAGIEVHWQSRGGIPGLEQQGLQAGIEVHWQSRGGIPGLEQQGLQAGIEVHWQSRGGIPGLEQQGLQAGIEVHWQSRGGIPGLEQQGLQAGIEVHWQSRGGIPGLEQQGLQAGIEVHWQSMGGIPGLEQQGLQAGTEMHRRSIEGSQGWNGGGAEHKQLHNMLGFEVTSMLCVPVISRATSQVVALACAFNKLGGESYTEADEHRIQHCFCYTSTVLTSTLAFQKEQKLKCECQVRGQLARCQTICFSPTDDVSVLLQEIITEARNLSNAEICSVFLLDTFSHELVAKVFDGGVVDDESYEIRIPADQGIAGHVATTGKILNIKDAYSHPLFYRGVDDSTGFRTRNILCFPIKNESHEVIGVAELVNKINGPWFSKFDEDLATAFSIYCGISIAHSLLYKKVHEAQYRSHVANEMMMYHMKVRGWGGSPGNGDVGVVASLEPYRAVVPPGGPVCATLPTGCFTLSLTAVLHPRAGCILGANSEFAPRGRGRHGPCVLIPFSLAPARFCLMVRKGYRDPPYHNWMHAFSVSHFCYLLYKNLELVKYLEDIEIFALFISCMCHDLDHRGTNNSFQVASKSVLAALYSSEGSVMERHHFAQAIAILNTHGCNIFDHFSRKDYQRMLDLMRDIILATDLAHHLRIFKDLQKMAEVGYDPENKQHHSLLLCLLMTSCDLSDQTKGWKTTRKIAELIYKEFFSQGDLEKAMGNRPMEMMDREKAYIPELQISFMEHIAMPIYKLLQDLFPRAAELYERVASNREQWTKVSHKFTIRGLPSNNSLDFLDEEYDLQGMDRESAKMNGCLDTEGHMETVAQ
uniref:Phosphodiesterase n=1 Tax=Gopherus agassizii TaxID=38772 RepID=A0A452IXW0_9SAUR